MFDAAQGDRVNKIAFWGHNPSNPDEPEVEGVTDKELDITLSRVQWLPPSTATLEGDFNGGNVVNLADYTKWRDSLGGPESLLMGNGDGLNNVDEADYHLWVANFGRSIPAPSTLIPEPATALSVGLLLAAAVHRRRRGVPLVA